VSALRRADATVMQPFEIGSAQCAALIAPYELCRPCELPPARNRNADVALDAITGDIASE